MIHVEVVERSERETEFSLAAGDRARFSPKRPRVLRMEGSGSGSCMAEVWADRWLILISMLTGLTTDEVENEGFVMLRDGVPVPVPAGVELLRVEVQH